MGISLELEKIRNELDVKHKQVSKTIVEIVRKINDRKILPKMNVEDDEKIVTLTWWDGNVKRSSWVYWAVIDGELTLFGNADYTGLRDFVHDVEDVAEELSKKRNYEALHRLAARLPIFLKKVIEAAEKKNEKLDETLTKLKTMLQILK